MSDVKVIGVKTANNGGCGECACDCHDYSIPIPGPHIPTCKFADLDYVPPDFVATVMAMTGRSDGEA